MIGFEYPAEPHLRRHGPEGYKDYESYRDWLRDEFMFRCVFCLHREKWYGRPATFHIEHFVPVAVNPLGRCEYTNLLYACATCNSAKSNILTVPDPCRVAFADCLRVQPDGTVDALNEDGELLRDVLDMNDRRNVEYRARWIRNLVHLQATHPELYEEYMGFPDDLPDLRPPRKRVPRNTKPEGAENCYFALRERGELPPTY
jgi:hypothetical protein